MKKFELSKTAQFKKCQATIATFTNEDGEKIEVFYSYTCPKLATIGRKTYQFTFENSRKEGEKTSSMTTSRQCNAWAGVNHHDLPKINLAQFEADYFDTRLEKYY